MDLYIKKKVSLEETGETWCVRVCVRGDRVLAVRRADSKYT